jgi:hypothetical protein
MSAIAAISGYRPQAPLIAGAAPRKACTLPVHLFEVRQTSLISLEVWASDRNFHQRGIRSLQVKVNWLVLPGAGDKDKLGVVCAWALEQAEATINIANRAKAVITR